jgi:serine/threonine protein kinase
MNPDRWQQLKSLFDEALKLDVGSRAEFLSRSCAGDEDLRRDVEALLASFSRAGSFIEQPAAQRIASVILYQKELSDAGQRVAHYEIIGTLGKGGMGEVYLAQDAKLGRKVALKLMPAELIGNRERLQRFGQEARAASALNHPNILTIYEIGAAEGLNFIATEFVDGQTLRDRMCQSPLTLGEIIDVAIQIASALAAAHAAGIVHRDIKPENIMLRRDDIVKVLDFGLAKLAEEKESGPDDLTRDMIRTEPGVVMGTVSYMSPEQARGLEVDVRTDIWSLGVVLYEVLAARLPFEGATLSDKLAAILKTEPVPLRQIVPTVPDELQRIVSKALRHERDDRYQTAKELLLDLRYLKKQVESEGETDRRVTGQSLLSSGTANPGVTQSMANTTLDAAGGTPTSSLSAIKRRKAAAVAFAALLVLALATLIYIYRPQVVHPPLPPSQRILSRLTFDPGLQSEPTWSPDGHFIAYSADRSGNFDIWAQPVGEGNPVQVTKSTAHDWQPDWSSDGKRLVFRSERDGGGLFVVSAPTGGSERKISSFGYRPSWSPDGSQVLFYSANLQNTPSPPKLYVVGMDGGAPREILADTLSTLTGRLRAAWHPDGKRVSLWAEKRGAGLTFLTAPLDGGSAVTSQISPAIDQQRRAAGVDLFDFQWAPSGQAIYFEGISRGVHNIWKVVVDAESLSWIGGPERLTTGPGPDGNLALSPDGSKLAFTTRQEQTRLWSLPFNAANGQLKGPGQPITPQGIDTLSFDVSRDSKKLAFITERAGKRELWEKSFADGSERSLTAGSGFSLSAPRWSRDGLRLAYVRSRPVSQERTEYEHTLEHAMVLLDVSNGNEQMLTSHHQQQGWSWDWTLDQQWILGSSQRETPGQWGLYLYPIAAAPNAETQAKLATSRPGYDAFNAHFSPDENWMCFIGGKSDDAGDVAIYVVRASGGEWVRISEGSNFNDKPRWSADGRTIYFISDRTGFFNIWGRRFDPVLGQPIGEALRVTNFESPGRMIPSKVVPMELSLAADRFVVPIMEVSGSIWILENVNQ